MIILKDGEPFKGDVNLDLLKVREAVSLGLWDEKELSDRGLVLCEPFAAPEGKVATGEPRYIETKEGQWVEEYDVADAPPPPLPPTREEKFFQSTGFTIEELKQLLGIG